MSFSTILFALMLGVAAAGTAARHPPSGTAMFVVRNDPRLCPSPRCGGYWVALANGARTRCQDGLRRPRCYAATAVSRSGKMLGRIAEGALVRGAIDIGRGELGELLVAALYAPVGATPLRGGYYRVEPLTCVTP